MTNNAEDIRRDIRMNDKRHETVNQFKYLGAIVTDEGSKPEILSRTAQATHAMSQLKINWKDKKHISSDKNKTDAHTYTINFSLCM